VRALPDPETAARQTANWSGIVLRTRRERIAAVIEVLYFRCDLDRETARPIAERAVMQEERERGARSRRRAAVRARMR
jgi:hypothetical protein